MNIGPREEIVMAVKRAANGADRKPEKNPVVSVSRPLVVEGLEYDEDGVATALGGRRAERAFGSRLCSPPPVGSAGRSRPRKRTRAHWRARAP